MEECGGGGEGGEETYEEADRIVPGKEVKGQGWTPKDLGGCEPQWETSVPVTWQGCGLVQGWMHGEGLPLLGHSPPG